MKIVFCTQNMAPFRMKWMDEVARYHEVHIFHLDEYEAGVNKKYISYVPERAAVHCEKRTLPGNHAIYREVSVLTGQADLIILDGYGFAGQLHLMLRLHWKKIPFLLSVDGGMAKQKERFWMRAVKTFFVSRASAYLSTSEDTDRFIQYYGGGRKTIYRHYFSGLSKAYVEKAAISKEQKYALRKELHLKNGFLVLVVGKFEFRKGFDLMLRALDGIGEQNQLCVCFIGASGWHNYEPYLTDRNRNKVCFVDFCGQNILKKYYLAADLMLLPTRYDAWGLVIPEAMANGIPVVTTRMCLAGRAMLEPEELIPAENVDAIRKIILKYMQMPEEERMKIGDRNIQRVQPYIIENAVLKDIRHFEEFVNERKNTGNTG